MEKTRKKTIIGFIYSILPLLTLLIYKGKFVFLKLPGLASVKPYEPSLGGWQMIHTLFDKEYWIKILTMDNQILPRELEALGVVGLYNYYRLVVIIFVVLPLLLLLLAACFGRPVTARPLGRHERTSREKSNRKRTSHKKTGEEKTGCEKNNREKADHEKSDQEKTGCERIDWGQNGHEKSDWGQNGHERSEDRVLYRMISGWLSLISVVLLGLCYGGLRYIVAPAANEEIRHMLENVTEPLVAERFGRVLSIDFAFGPAYYSCLFAGLIMALISYIFYKKIYKLKDTRSLNYMG